MSEPWGFNAQAWMQNRAAIALTTEQARGAAQTAKQEELKTMMMVKAFASQREVEETLKRIGPDITRMAGSDPATAMANIAGILSSAGMPEAAAKMLGDAATATKDSASAAKLRLDSEVTLGQYIGSAFSNVQDRTDWDAAVVGLMSNFPEEKEHIMRLSSIPEGQENFDYAAASASISKATLTQLEASRKQASEAQALASRQQAAESAVRVRDLIPSQVRVNEKRAAYIEKQGGKSPAAEMATREDAKSLIQRDYETVSEDEASVLALKLKDAADDIKRDNPMLTRTESLERAYRAAKQSGMFAGLEVKTGEAGGSKDNPIVVPRGELPPKEELLDNQWYEVFGRTLIWDEPSGEFYTPDEKATIDGEENETPEDEGEY